MKNVVWRVFDIQLDVTGAGREVMRRIGGYILVNLVDLYTHEPKGTYKI